MLVGLGNDLLVLRQNCLLDYSPRFRVGRKSNIPVGSVAQLLGGKRDGESRRGLDDFEFPDQKTIIEANDRMGFDRAFLVRQILTSVTSMFIPLRT